MLNTKNMELVFKESNVKRLSERFPNCSIDRIQQLYEKNFRLLYDKSSPAIRESDTARHNIFIFAYNDTKVELEKEYGAPSSNYFVQAKGAVNAEKRILLKKIMKFFGRSLPPESNGATMGAPEAFA